MPTLQTLHTELAKASITLYTTPKAVKNINFRIKPHALHVSHPHRITSAALARAILSRMAWVLDAHTRLIASPRQPTPTPLAMPTLWGKPIHDTQSIAGMSGINPTIDLSDPDTLIGLYRHELTQKLPILAQKWQPIVGKSAREIRLKKMTTRWGTCNTRHARIWLSVYLAAHPYECTEYVFVHELCHLHYANHSSEFWACVARAMPDYKKWHDLLKKVGSYK